jgi:DNA-binding NarL/FixJ family response regulator
MLPIPTMLQLSYIRRLANGQQVTEIAERRGVTRQAVQHQLEEMYRRYQCRSAAHLVATAIRADWLPSYRRQPTAGLPAPEGTRLFLIQMLAAGLSVLEIAAKRGVLRSSVKDQLDVLYRRYNVRRQAQLVVLAFKHGWIK